MKAGLCEMSEAHSYAFCTFWFLKGTLVARFFETSDSAESDALLPACLLQLTANQGIQSRLRLFVLFR